MKNISHLFTAGNFPTFERDPGIVNLENQVLQQMANITKQISEKYGPEHVQNEAVRFVSVEEAVQELIKIKNELS